MRNERNAMAYKELGIVDTNTWQIATCYRQRKSRAQVTVRAVLMSRVLLGNRLQAVQGGAGFAGL